MLLVDLSHVGVCLIGVLLRSVLRVPMITMCFFHRFGANVRLRKSC